MDELIERSGFVRQEYVSSAHKLRELIEALTSSAEKAKAHSPGSSECESTKCPLIKD
ncbi:MAG: hypothetical protein KBD78_00345 [Oligoflexales bacterium]|nr:hypothetical protein [Oligoflexales bacterium]